MLSAVDPLLGSRLAVTVNHNEAAGDVAAVLKHPRPKADVLARAQVVSGTPGRVFDMIRRRNLRTRALKMLVIDEADEMLNRGFKEQIYDIYRYLPPSTQVVLISATLPQEVLEQVARRRASRDHHPLLAEHAEHVCGAVAAPLIRQDAREGRPRHA